MVVARIGVGLMFLAFLVLAGVAQVQHRRVVQLEKEWTLKLDTMTPARSQRLRADLADMGARLKREGSSTILTFLGSDEAYVRLVNRLLEDPVVWTRWNCQRISATTVKGTLYLSKI